MKVSVIVVTHSAYEKYLKQTLRTLKGHEVIVQTNQGTLAQACNRAIERSTGEYLIRVDSDDWIEPNLIELELEYLEDNKVDAVWCDYWKTYQTGETHYMEHCPNLELEHACGVLYKRECWEQLGGYNETLKYQESYDFWIRFKKRFTSKRLEAPLYYYRQHPDSMSTNPQRLKVRKEIDQWHKRSMQTISR